MESIKPIHSPLNTVASTKDIKVSYFKNAKSTKKAKDIFISEYLALVSDQTKRAEAERLRALTIDEYKKAKLLQPCITGSGTTGQGRAIETKNGLAVIDFDQLPNGYNDWQELKKDLQNDPYTFIVHFSLSGRGLCVFVKIPKENNFKEIYLSFAEYYDLMFGARLDFLADESRLRFIAYDPAPFYNHNSEVYKDILKEDLQEEPTQQDNDFSLNEYSNDPAIAFNNLGAKCFDVINPAAEAKGYTITEGKGKESFVYQRPGGMPRSIVALDNEEIIKFAVKSSTLEKEFGKAALNPYEFYKILKGLTDYEALKELSTLGYGTFNEPKIMKPNGKETYSLNMEYLKDKNIRLNQLTGVIEIGNQSFNDFHISNMLTELSLFSGKNQSKEILLSCMDVIANGNQFHPFLEFVKALKDLPETDFSKPDAMDNFLDCYDSTTPKMLKRIYFTRWMLGLFDLHVHNRMTKNVMLLSGAQNSGKTSAKENSLPEPLKQYGKVVEFNQNKMTDAKIALCSILVACFDEGEDILSKSRSLSDFKNLTSSYDIYERRPYRRNHERMFRSSIIMLTTNEKNILDDSTGSTRFLTIDVQAFDLEKYLKIDMNAVWRSIYDLHLKGETSVLNEAERALQAKENINFESEDFIVGLIESVFHKDENGFLTSTEILIELEKNTKQTLTIKRIGQALRKMGLDKTAKKIKGRVLRGYTLKFSFES